MAPKPGHQEMWLAPPPSGSAGALRLPSREVPDVDDHVVEPETREQLVRGRRVVAMRALPPHGDRHFKLDYVIGAHVKEGYVGSADLLTRSSESSDFATDTCIRREGFDPRTNTRIQPGSRQGGAGSARPRARRHPGLEPRQPADHVEAATYAGLGVEFVGHGTYARAWTVLSRRYEEVLAAGLRLFRARSGFPSLFVTGRPNVARPKKAPCPGAAPNGEPEADATPPAEPVVSPPA